MQRHFEGELSKAGPTTQAAAEKLAPSPPVPPPGESRQPGRIRGRRDHRVEFPPGSGLQPRPRPGDHAVTNAPWAPVRPGAASPGSPTADGAPGAVVVAELVPVVAIT
jgi:hypothetical protein